MSYIVMLLVMVFGAVLQAVLPGWAVFGFGRWPVLFGIVVYYAMTRELEPFLRAAVLAGLFMDALGATPLGYSSFCFCLVGWLINRLRDQVFIQKGLTHAVFGSLGNLASNLLLALLMISGRHLTPIPGQLAQRCLSALILGALVVPIVFRLLAALEKQVGTAMPGERI